MKKLLFIIALIIVLMCSLLACSNSESTDNSKYQETTHTHVFGEWHNTIDPTCVSEGQAERICSCGEKESKVLSKLRSYNLGNKVEDLKFVVDDGSTFSLYETLKESKAVLLVFDLNSFDMVQNALNNYPDAEAVGIADTAEYKLIEYKANHNIEFPCTIKSYADSVNGKFNAKYVLIDRDAKICALHNESAENYELNNLFRRAFKFCTKEDYVFDTYDSFWAIPEYIITPEMCAEHSFLSFETTKEATCSEYGVKSGNCKHCGVYFEEKYILDHTYVFNVCSVCGDKRFSVDVNNFVLEYNDRTCTLVSIRDKAVTDIIIPEGVTEIKEGALSGCSNLETLTLAFSNFDKPLISFFGRTYYENSYEVEVNTGSYNMYYVPSSLKTINILGGEIGFNDFSGLTQITTVNIGSNVSKINNPFEDCPYLTNVTIAKDNPYYTIIENDLYSKDGTTLIQKTLFPTLAKGAYIDILQMHKNGELSITIEDTETKVVYLDHDINVVNIVSYVAFIQDAITNGREYSILITVNNNPYYYKVSGCLIETQTQTLIYAEDNATIPNDGSVKHIGDLAFMGYAEDVILPIEIESIYTSSFTSNVKVFYEGTEEDWNNVTVHTGVNGAIYEQIVYYSETAPTGDGNYWHYVDGIPTIWN